METGTEKSNRTRSQLANLIIEDSDFLKLESSLSTYCPFEAVGMVNAEIRHSAFLAHALDPYRPHEFGAEFLRVLLDTILKELEAPPISRLELHLADFDSVDVRREWRHIDVLVVLPAPRLVIAFELKIGAGEGHEQLSRYGGVLEENWPTSGEQPWRHLKLFLTRTAEEPSDESWYPVDYRLIISAIDRFNETADAGSPLARQTLTAYADMLRRRHMGNPALEKIAETLWKKHAEALTYLMENRPDADGGLAQMLIDNRLDFAKEISRVADCGLTLVPDESNKRWIRFQVEQWTDIPGFTCSSWTPSGHIILIQIEVDPTFVKLFITLGPGPEEERSKFFAVCEDLMRRKSAKSMNGWKTISSRFVVLPENMSAAGGPDRLFDDIRVTLTHWMQNEVSAVDLRLRTLAA